MSFLGVLFFLIFGGRLIRFLIRSFNNSVQDHGRESRGPYENTNHDSQADREAQQEAYRKWQEEVYRRYRESQYQYQQQQQQQQYNQYYQQGYSGYQNTYQPRPQDPKLEEVRRMYGHPLTLDELDDKQRELRKKLMSSMSACCQLICMNPMPWKNSMMFIGFFN